MKRPRRRTVVWTIVVLLLALFPYTWGPALAGRIARHYLDLGEKGSSSCTVDRLSLFRVKARDIRLGAVPGAPRVGRVDARFTPWGLLRGRGLRLAVEGAEMDFKDLLPPAALERVANATAAARLDLDWKPSEGYRGELRGQVLGGALGGELVAPTWREPKVTLSYDPALRGIDLPGLRAEGRARLSETTNGLAVAATADAGFEGTSWRISADAGARDGAFAAFARLPHGRFDQDDALLAPLLRAFAPTNLAPRFSGLVTGAVSVARAAGEPVPTWEVSARLQDLDAGGRVGEQDAALAGGRAFVRVTGFGPHADLQPFGVLFKEASLGHVRIDDGSFWFRGGGDSLLLTEGRAGFCGGVVRVYALHMNLASLDAGFTVMLDGLEAGELLGLFPNVRGTATGKLYGKLPLAIRNGSAVRLRDAYLFSPPGQVGRIELEDSAVVVDKLRQSGVPEEACESLEKALHNLDYDVLRFDLTRNEDGENRLAIRLDGTAAEGKKRTPVNLRLNLNGDLEETINVAIEAAGLRPSAATGSGSR
jgi:hypothetical protein